MKKQFAMLLFGFVFLCGFQSCFHIDDNDISVSVSDDEDVCHMSASYPKRKTRAVQRMLDEHLGDYGSMSFKNATIDGDITLDDHTTFYIEMFPGELNIRFDKTENSEASYEKVKEAFDDIKDLLAHE